jgi:hypothetical protein
MRFRRRLAIALLAASMAGGTALAAPASASTPTLLSQKALKWILLPMAHIKAATGVTDLTSDGVTCHHAPYYSGHVNYCYHDSIVSRASQASGVMWPNHVDVIALKNDAAAARYLRETKRDKKPTVIASSADRVVLFDKQGIVKTVGPDGKVVAGKGPVVSVYAISGPNSVYTECTQPGATTPTALRACAENLADMQLKRLASAG